MNMNISKAVIYLLLTTYLVFLTFKDLISIDIGFVVRIPHLIIGATYLCLLFYILTISNKLRLKYLWFLFFLIIVLSISNKSIFNVYFYYLAFIILSCISIFEVLSYYEVSSTTIAKLFILSTIVHIIMSYFTLTKAWYGGYQLISYSDFSTFFATQLSIIFPFIFYLENKKLKIFVCLLYGVTLLLLAARGAIIALILSYLLVNFRKIKISSVFAFLLAVIVIYIVNPNLVGFYASKLNPYSSGYAAYQI